MRGSLAEHFLKKADVLFSIGSSLFPNRFSHAIPDADKKTIVQCTVDTLDINRSYETRNAVIGDAKLTLAALAAELSAKTGGARKRPEVLEEIKKGKEAFLAKFRPWMESDETPINPYRVFGDLMKVLDPKSSFVTADSGNTRDQTSTVYEAQIPRGYLGWGNVSTLGFSLAGAAAAKLAFPNRQCVNVTGDAGVCYMMGNFEAIARYKIGITTHPHQQRRVLGLRARLLGRGPRSLHVEGVRSRERVHGVDGAGGGLPRRGRDQAVGDHPGAQARASTKTPRAGRPSSSSSARTIPSTGAGFAPGPGH